MDDFGPSRMSTAAPHPTRVNPCFAYLLRAFRRFSLITALASEKPERENPAKNKRENGIRGVGHTD